MHDVILQGTIDDLRRLLSELDVSTRAWMLLERRDDWFQKEGQEKIIFATFSREVEAEKWDQGCIFDYDSQLRWQRTNGEYRVTFSGTKPLISVLQAADLSLADCEAKEVRYLLWGKKLDNPEEYGIRSDSPVFLELQIPRLLTYPVSAKANRVWLCVREYYSRQTGLLVHFRWFYLHEEVNEPDESL